MGAFINSTRFVQHAKPEIFQNLCNKTPVLLRLIINKDISRVFPPAEMRYKTPYYGKDGPPMKQKIAVLLSLLFLFASFYGCAAQDGAPASDTSTQSGGEGSSISMDTSSSVSDSVPDTDRESGSNSTGSSSSSSAPEGENTSAAPAQDEPETYPASQLVDTSGIEKIYSSAGNARKGILDLPCIEAFENNYVFTAGGYTFPPSDTQFSEDGYTVTRYDLSQQSAPVTLSFPMHYMDVMGQMVLSEDKLVYAPLAADGLTIALLDFAEGNVTSVLSDERGMPSVSFARLSGDAFAFCYRRENDLARVVLCEAAGNTSIIYETPPDSKSQGNPHVFSIDASEDTIYLLEEREQDGKSSLYYVCLDTSGNVLHEYNFDFLAAKEDAIIIPDQLTVCGDYILIRFSHNSSQPSFMVLRQDGDTFTQLDVPKPYPLWRLTEGPVDGRYLLFEAGADTVSSTAAHSKDIAIFDTETESWKLVKLRDNTRGEMDVHCSSDGRMIFYDNHFTVKEHNEWFVTDLAQCLAEP